MPLGRVHKWIVGFSIALGAIPAAAAPPVFGTASYSAALDETAGIDSPVMTVEAADADGDAIVYAIRSGNAAGTFAIDAATGSVTLAQALDYATVKSYTLSVTATAGGETAAVPLVVTVKEVAGGDIAELIRSTKPMTAVLFSQQDRNSFEVIKDPVDPTLGLINQNQRGSTGGLLIAAEAPFAFPEMPMQENGECPVVPIGAWFGVNFQDGGGSDVDSVELAAGLSVSFISSKRSVRIEKGEGLGLTGSARLLLGVVYGDVTTLGTAGAGATLQVGDRIALGETVPVQREKKLSFAWGIGFRF